MLIAIVDDKREDMEYLRSMLENYCTLHSTSAEITCFSSGDTLLENFHPGKFQCIFLDIYMEGTDGMETAREIYRQDPACRLIFCTVSISHAVTSYEVRAAWYLTKPITEKRLADAMDAACTDIMQNDRTFTIHTDGIKLNIQFKDIYFMDCMNRRARLHLRQRVLQLDEHISALAERLTQDKRFLVCNRNIIVNMDHIERIEEHAFRLKNDTLVPLRQRGRTALKKAFLDWSLRELRKDTWL